jgi:hypothetical protein
LQGFREEEVVVAVRRCSLPVVVVSIPVSPVVVAEK